MRDSDLAPGRAPRRHGPGALIRRGAVVGMAAAVLGGCAKVDAALSQQWAVVHFTPSTPVAALLQVRKACPGGPNIRVQALPRKRDGLGMLYALRYDTSHAGDGDLARLQQCLQKFPSVAGIDFQTAGGS